MPRILKSDQTLVLINTFKVAPENADELLAVLTAATDEVMRYVPGFISASFHKALDGKSVANYAQWESEEAFNAMLKDENARIHMKKAGDLAESFEPIQYKAVSVHEHSVA